MKGTAGRYSKYIRPFSFAFDIVVINVMAWYFLQNEYNTFGYHFFIIICWFAIAWNIDFYEVYRFSKELKILAKGLKQGLFFGLVNFAYLGFFSKQIDSIEVLKFITSSMLIVMIVKYSIYYLLKHFRVVFKGNLRNVIIVGKNQDATELASFFDEHPDYGYNLVKIFDVKSDSLVKDQKKIEAIFSFVKENNIDEIYCSISELEENQISKFVDFTDNNLKVLKFLPNRKEIISRNLIFDYYGYIPVISQRIIPLDKRVNKLSKRLFDIVFSSIVILGVLSWFTPIVGLLIRLESKGSIFFKQRRNGLNYQEFECYKFRSMRPNSNADLLQVSKNDPRITKIGAFLRKTSLDELPQFFNVFLGDMSVVGPRPHMVKETNRFAQKVDKFMVRHLIKPGITGMAQINGYRGEVETKHDIINRVKYDIFYVENWSLLLDFKIISKTVVNIFKGDEKAY